MRAVFDARAYLEAFAAAHVHREFRARFVHEALKKPAKLHYRICHVMDDVFPSRYANGKVPFAENDLCVAITGKGAVPTLEPLPWRTLKIHEQEGFGLLVGSLDGSRFYAESESDYRYPFFIYSCDGKPSG
jgi:hypothetical protein